MYLQAALRTLAMREPCLWRNLMIVFLYYNVGQNVTIISMYLKISEPSRSLWRLWHATHLRVPFPISCFIHSAHTHTLDFV